MSLKDVEELLKDLAFVDIPDGEFMMGSSLPDWKEHRIVKED